MPGGSNTNWDNMESERTSGGGSRSGSGGGGNRGSRGGSRESAKERYARQQEEFDRQVGKDVHKELANKARSKNEE